MGEKGSSDSREASMKSNIKEAIKQAVREAGGVHQIIFSDADVPNVCTACGHEGCPAEPDVKNFTCEACGSESRTSVLVLLGLI